MSGGCACRALKDGIQMSVRVTPRGGRDAVIGLDTRDGAAPAIKLRVAAARTDGAANAAVIRLIADLLNVPPSRVQLIGGQQSRHKLLFVEGDAPALTRLCMENLPV